MRIVSDMNMVNWAINSTVILLLVLVLRRLYGEKISRRMRYGLWLVVLARLLVPFSFGNSGFSVQNWIQVEMAQEQQLSDTKEGSRWDGSRQAMQTDGWFHTSQDTSTKNPQSTSQDMRGNSPQSTSQNSRENSSQSTLQNSWEHSSQSTLQNSRENSSQSTSQNSRNNPPQTVGEKAALLLRPMLLIWRMGSLAGLVWVVVVNAGFSLHLKKTRCSVGKEQGRDVYVVPDLISPCLFGPIRPAIYLTPQVAAREELRCYAVLHEDCHRAHGDHLWGVLRGVSLALWWWNPLVWLAAGLSRRDCELACDEACVERLGEDFRQEYGVALIRSLQEPSDETGRRYSGGAGRRYPGAAATLFCGKEELKARLQALTRRPLVRYSAMAMVAVTVLLGVLITFTGQANGAGTEEGSDDGTTVEGETLVGETSSEKDETGDAVGQTDSIRDGLEQQTDALIREEDKLLNGTVEVNTYAFPWSTQYTVQTTETGADVSKEVVPVFAKNCSYYINKIQHNDHGIDYEAVDEETFLSTIATMQEKKYEIRLQLVYQQNTIVAAYLKSDQQVISYVDDAASWDPERPQAYQFIGLEAYTLQREYQADISDAEGVETIQIAATVINDGPAAVMAVRDGAGELLYAEDILVDRHNVEEILLIGQDGVQSLMVWSFCDEFSDQGYRYRVFRLDAQGNPVPSAAAGYTYGFALNQGYHVYAPDQLALWAWPVSHEYMTNATLLAGVNGAVSEELYYEFRGPDAYDYKTLQAQVEAAQMAYWEQIPAAAYEEPDFEETVAIREFVQEDGRLWLRKKN